MDLVECEILGMVSFFETLLLLFLLFLNSNFYWFLDESFLELYFNISFGIDLISYFLDFFYDFFLDLLFSLFLFSFFSIFSS